MGKLGHQMVMETPRKWIAGETMPRNAAAKLLAQVLGVTPAWLTLGDRTSVGDNATKQRNALALGPTNLIAGMIQMAGWNVAFPTIATDARIQVIICGVMYSIHVTAGTRSVGGWDFSVPVDAINNFVIGVCELGPFHYALVELDKNTLENASPRNGGVVYITVHADFIGSRRIESFAARL